MKYLIFIGLFVAGGTVGYLVGVNQNEEVVQPTNGDKELITEFVYDTIVEHQTVEVPVYTELKDTTRNSEDTLISEEFLLDTLQEKIQPRDTVLDTEELSIRRDELIASQRIPIVYLDEPVEKDSLIKDMLGIKENRPKEMNVQFWQSPIGYSGYKLSKNTLILYGLSDQFDYKVYHKNEMHYLTNDEVYYVLKETLDFLPYQEVDERTVLND